MELIQEKIDQFSFFLSNYGVKEKEISSYCEALLDLPYDLITYAINRHKMNNRKMITPSELRRLFT